MSKKIKHFFRRNGLEILTGLIYFIINNKQQSWVPATNVHARIIVFDLLIVILKQARTELSKIKKFQEELVPPFVSHLEHNLQEVLDSDKAPLDKSVRTFRGISRLN